MKIRPTLDEVWRVKKMIKEAIVKIVNKQDLSYDEAYAVMNEIMSGETTPTRTQLFWRRFPPRAPRLRPRTKLRAAPPPCATTPPRWTPAWISLRSLAPAATTPTASTSPPPEQVAKMAGIADGAIVGSAIIKLLEQYGKDAPEHIGAYVKSMKDAVREYTI